jgi:CBS domain-containing protein
MTTGVDTCRPYDSVSEAARIMWEQDCGAVPVVDGDGVALAMLTDRDVCMAAFTQGRPLTEIRVSSAMSQTLWSCRPEDDLLQAEAKMRSHRVRRLPVVDSERRLVGILSLSDLAREALVEVRAKAKRKAVKFADVGETLSAISTPGAA